MEKVSGFKMFVVFAALFSGLLAAISFVSAQGPTITSFSASGVSGSDNFVNINDKAQASCTATDASFIKEMSIMEITPDGANKTAYFESVSGSQITKTISVSNIDVSGATGQKLAGTYQFYCKSTNKNNTLTESNKISVAFPAECATCPEPSDWSACAKVNGAGNQQRNVYGCSGSPEYVCTVASIEERACDLCNSKNLQYCNTTSKCASAGGSWNITSNACSVGGQPGQLVASPSASPVGTVSPSQTSPAVAEAPSIIYIGFERPGTVVGEEAKVVCSALGANGLKEIKITITSPIGKATNEISAVNESSASASIKSYNLTDEGKYSVACIITDAKNNIVAASKLIDVPARKENPLQTLPVAGEANVLVDKSLTATENATATKPAQINVPVEVSSYTSVEKLVIDVSNDISAEDILVEIKAFDSLPAVDDHGQSVQYLPSIEQPVVKAIQFTASEKLTSVTKSVAVEFSLTESEMESNGLKEEDVVLARFADGKWTELPTEALGQNRFKGISPGFSVFAVTRKASSVIEVPVAAETPKISSFSCETNSDCSWYSANGCSENSGAIWKCGVLNAPFLIGESEEKSCSDLYIPKPKTETCGCIEGSGGQKKCAPIDVETKQEQSLIKSRLLDALITIEQFKIRFDHLSKRSGQIADYYLSADNSQDYTTWATASQAFSNGVISLDSVRKDIKSVKDNPVQDDLDKINKKIEDIVKLLDASLDFLLKDVLDVGPLEKEETVLLAPGQSVKFRINGEIHTLTVNSIENGKVNMVVSSTPTALSLSSGQQQALLLADTSVNPDTGVTVASIGKNYAHIKINSLFAEKFAAAKQEIACTDVGATGLTLTQALTQTCFNIVADNAVLDGGGNTVDGGGLEYGISAVGIKGVTIKNIVLKNFLTGIKFLQTTGSTIKNVEINSMMNGINLTDSSGNTISNNKVQIGKRIQKENIGAAKDDFVLNEVLLQDGPTDGSYTIIASITSNIDQTKYTDATGSGPLNSIDFAVAANVKGDNPAKKNGSGATSLRKGQTALVKLTDSVVYPKDNKAEFDLIVSYLGQSKTFNKIIDINSPQTE